MADTQHLLIVKGVEEGRQISISKEGARVGRSSSNDVSIQDPSLSRFHCRMFFKDGQLAVGDLGSSNQTMVNNSPITEVTLNVGDHILIGDTVIKVINNGTESTVPAPTPSPADPIISVPAPGTPPLSPEQVTTPGPATDEPIFNFDNPPPAENIDTPPPPSGETASTDSIFDLGLNKTPDTPQLGGKKEGKNLKPLIMLVVVMVILVVGIFVIKEIFKTPPKDTGTTTNTTTQKKKVVLYPVEISYEKIKTDPDNIFRFSINIDREGKLSAEIDNIKENRHVTKTDVQVDKDVLENLAQHILKEDFYSLQNEYMGLTKGAYDSYDLMITIGKQAHAVYVKNTTEPDSFKEVRELIEKFVEKELNLITISRAPEELQNLAYEAWLGGKRFYDEKDIDGANLMNGIKALNEVELYLQSIEPKPDYYAQALTLKRRATEELEQRYDDAIFLFQKNSQAKEWAAAAGQLRNIMDMLPDSDERYKDARKELIIVEGYLDNK